MPNAASSMTALTTVKPRLRNSDSGTIGSGVRACQATNATSSSAAADQAAQHLAAGPAVAVAADQAEHDAEQAGGDQHDAERVEPAGAAAALPGQRQQRQQHNPMGTLIQKIHCQDAYSVMPPPMTGPSATPRPPIAPHSPSARPRRSGAVTLASRVSVSGMTIAPPTPCTARAAISTPMLGASAAAALASGEHGQPDASSRRRPNRSPSAAPVSRNTAKLSV